MVVLDAARAAGAVSPRRVLDSAPIYDAVATQDTVTMLRSAIRQTLAAADAAGFGPRLRAVLRRRRRLRLGRQGCVRLGGPRGAWGAGGRARRGRLGGCLRRCGAGPSAPTRPTRPSCWPPFRARTSRRAPTTRCASRAASLRTGSYPPQTPTPATAARAPREASTATRATSRWTPTLS